MKYQEATAEVARFNETMETEGLNVSAEWIGGYYPLEVHCGRMTLTPAVSFRDVADVRSALQSTLVEFRGLGAVGPRPAP